MSEKGMSLQLRKERLASQNSAEKTMPFFSGKRNEKKCLKPVRRRRAFSRSASLFN
jgi:hypothetical protein